MQKKTKIGIIAAALATAVLVGAGITAASAAGGPDDDAGDGADTQLVGTDLEQASAAALEATGGGRVIETEVGDDGAAYGVEIETTDGRVIEVQLDGSFNVIGQETDDDGSEGGTETE